jgi:hypothetical protein
MSVWASTCSVTQSWSGGPGTVERQGAPEVRILEIEGV